MKTFAIGCILIALQTFSLNAQELNKAYFEEKVGIDILIDRCDRAGLEGPEFGEYFVKEYETYEFNQNITDKLSKKIEGISIKIVLGTWCHDSKMQVPRFFKILDQIEFDDSKLNVICVDRAKKTHAFSIDDLEVDYVPTFIIYKDGEEIGRIIESPEITLEEDFLNILK